MYLISERPETVPILNVMAPVSGQCIPLQQVPQAITQLGLFGTGVAILPSSQRLCAPASSVVKYLSADRRCVSLQFTSGLACRIELWHAFEATLPVASAGVKQGSKVRAGEQLMIINPAALTDMHVMVTFSPTTAKVTLLPHYGRAIASEDVILSLFNLEQTEDKNT